MISIWMIIMFKKTHIFALSILSLSIQHAFAQNSQQEVDVNDLPTIELQAQSTPKDHLNHAAGDTVIGKDQLVQGATTIGNALNLSLIHIDAADDTINV